MKLRFGLIGLGKHGLNAVAPVFSQPACTGGELVAVCDSRPEALEAFPGDEVERYSDVAALLSQAPIDAVYVAAGMDRHRDIVLRAIGAGKHVIVEKPMAESPEACREMTNAADAAGLILAVNFESRFGEQMRILKKWVDDQRFGRIEAIHFENLWDGHKSFGPVAERRARLMELAGALDCGIHKLDQARFLAGGGWADLHARGAWMGENFTPPTHIGIVGQLETGVLVTVNASLSWAAHIEPRPMINTIRLAGTEGVAVVQSSYDFQSTTMELFSRTLKESHTIGTAGHTSDIVHVVNEFTRVVEHGWDDGSVLARGEDGYWAQWATAEANRQSIESRVKP